MLIPAYVQPLVTLLYVAEFVLFSMGIQIRNDIRASFKPKHNVRLRLFGLAVSVARNFEKNLRLTMFLSYRFSDMFYFYHVLSLFAPSLSLYVLYMYIYSYIYVCILYTHFCPCFKSSPRFGGTVSAAQLVDFHEAEDVGRRPYFWDFTMRRIL